MVKLIYTKVKKGEICCIKIFSSFHQWQIWKVPDNYVIKKSYGRSCHFGESIYHWNVCKSKTVVILTWHQSSLKINPSRPDPGRWEKTNLNFYFHFFVVP